MMSQDSDRVTFMSTFLGKGSVYEQLDQELPTGIHGRARSGALPRLESDDEDDLEAQVHLQERVATDDTRNMSNTSTERDHVFLRSRYFKPARAANNLLPKERALWKWANVENLDTFLCSVYAYFLGSGFYAILLARALNMLTLAFVITFSTYFTSCIDYSKIPESTKLSEIRIPHCMASLGTFHLLTLWTLSVFFVLKSFQYLMDVPRLIDMKNFYEQLLNVPEDDMQTVSWQHVVNQLVLLWDQNLITARRGRTSPHMRKKHTNHAEIANRIMRQENYLIALINKQVLDLTIPIPGLRHVQFLTKTMEWHLNLCIMDFAFNEQGQLRPVFLKESHRSVLSEGLRRRFLFAGFMNIIVAPFGIVYLTLLYFFQYYGEYHKNPSSIGSRQYSPFAEWTFREYNELTHLFRRRLRLSFEPANQYINQFPKEKTNALVRFVSFIAGSFAAVLGIVSLLGPEQFLGFEVTPGRTVLFYIGLFTTILAVSRGMSQEETLVFDPETALKKVAHHTHYLPKNWQNRLHSDRVKTEFSALYQYKLLIIAKEVASVVIAPFVLWYSLPKSSDAIVDFFRDHSVHVDGLGYICSFAVFNFDRIHNVGRNGTDDYSDETDVKMMKSYINFNDSYGLPPNRHGRQVMDVAADQSNASTPKHHGIKLDESVSEYDYDPAQYTETDEVTAHFENGGVLGLLNQFYKQAGEIDERRV